MDGELLNYIDAWERDTANKVKVHMMAGEFFGNVYNIEIRFSAEKYYSDLLDYEKICRDVKWLSNGSFYVSSSEDELRMGAISIKVAFANKNYTDKMAITVIKTTIDNLNT